MSIDTEIKGNPGNIERAASWLRDKLEVELSDAGDEFNDARKSAASTWNSSAGDQFVSVMENARDETDDLAKAAKAMAGDLDDFAGSLRSCQTEMGTCRTTATTDELTVTGFTIVDPGEGPARPPDDFEGTDVEVTEHNKLVVAYDDHQDLIRAYNKASREADRIDRKYAKACRDLQEAYQPGEHAAWLLTLGEITGDGALAGLATQAGLKHKSALLTRATDLITEANEAIDDLQRHPERYIKRKWFFLKTLDATKLEADRLAILGRLDEATDLLDQAGKVDAPPPSGKLPKFLKGGGKILGPLGVGIGVYNDYQEGESNTQIAVSQGGSLVAGTLTGMAIGAAVGSVVPVAGTAVGAVVGTVIGAGIAIFSDGAIDSLFENGPDLSEAASEGWESIKDTGGAIKDGLGKIGGLFG